MLERLFKEVKRRTKVMGVHANETSASTLVTETRSRSSEEWALKRYLTMDALKVVGKLNQDTRDIDTMYTCSEKISCVGASAYYSERCGLVSHCKSSAEGASVAS